MNTLRFLKVLLFLMCTLPAIGQSDRFLSTGYSALQENGWKDWTTASDDGFAYYWYYRFTLKNPSGTVRFMTRKAV